MWISGQVGVYHAVKKWFLRQNSGSYIKGKTWHLFTWPTKIRKVAGKGGKARRLSGDRKQFHHHQLQNSKTLEAIKLDLIPRYIILTSRAALSK